MNSLLDRFSLPLLTKELTEQSARKRTYVVRVLYVSGLFLSVGLFFLSEVYYRYRNDPLAILGQGRDLFFMTVAMQFLGIYIFVPVLASGQITREKERDSLQLLLLTRLTPRTIVLEKLLGQLVPMCLFFLASVPFMTLAYTLGGVTPSMLWGGVWCLVVTAFQVTALAVACSSWARTTPAAFFQTLAIGAFCFFGPAILHELRIVRLGQVTIAELFTAVAVAAVFVATAAPIAAEILSLKTGSSDVLSQIRRNLVLCFVYLTAVYVLTFLLGLLAAVISAGWNVSQISTALMGLQQGFDVEWLLFGPYHFFDVSARKGLAACVLGTMPMVCSGIACLAFATSVLIPRSDLPGNNIYLKAFRRIDALVGLNGRFKRGMRLTQVASLPDDQPIAWRESARSITGSPAHLCYMFVLMEIPLLLLCAAVTGGYGRATNAYWVSELFALMQFGLWIATVLAVSSKAASLFSSERSHQTFDLLMTTPLTSREILVQKLWSVGKVILVCWLLMTTLNLAEYFWVKSQLGGIIGRRQPWMPYPLSKAVPDLRLACATATSVIYLPMVSLLSLLIGLQAKTQVRAIFGSIVALVVWCVGPILLLLPLRVIGGMNWLFDNLCVLSPAAIIPFNQFYDLDDLGAQPVTVMLRNSGLYLLISAALWFAVLWRVDRDLGRLTERPSGMPEADPRSGS